MTQVAALLPSGAKIVLMADREYGSVGLFQFLVDHRWFFVIWMKKDVWLRMANGRKFQIGEIPLKPGQMSVGQLAYQRRRYAFTFVSG